MSVCVLFLFADSSWAHYLLSVLCFLACMAAFPVNMIRFFTSNINLKNNIQSGPPHWFWIQFLGSSYVDVLHVLTVWASPVSSKNAHKHALG